MRIILCVTLTLLTCFEINGLTLPAWEGLYLGKATSQSRKPSLTWFSRKTRLPVPSHKVIDPVKDCFFVTSDEGQLFYKSPSDEPTVCGIYMIAKPNMKIQVTFNYLDVSCDNGGLVAWVDGWELNGKVWPAEGWDEDDRVMESCNQRPRTILVSQQNAALLQYRVPARGKGFAITVRHIRNAKPCDILVYGTEGVYTLRNHGMAKNCSLLTIAPSAVRILTIDVGRTTRRTSGLEIETGIIHRCIKRGLSDYVDVGGASGLDTSAMEILDSVCGLNSNEGLTIELGTHLDLTSFVAGVNNQGKYIIRLNLALISHLCFDWISLLFVEKLLELEDRRAMLIACENTIARMVSSGGFYNSITLLIQPLEPQDLERANLFCSQ